MNTVPIFQEFFCRFIVRFVFVIFLDCLFQPVNIDTVIGNPRAFVFVVWKHQPIEFFLLVGLCNHIGGKVANISPFVEVFGLSSVFKDACIGRNIKLTGYVHCKMSYNGVNWRQAIVELVIVMAVDQQQPCSRTRHSVSTRDDQPVYDK